MTGILYYIIGASGAGKDSVLNAAREQLASNGKTLIAHRYITRAADAGGENHIALSLSEFAARKACGLFKMDWAANNCQYALGVEIDQWLGLGLNVIVNGSRGYLTTAKTLHPALRVIYIDVDAQILKQRLINRGRESELEINARLERHKKLSAHIDKSALRIDNSGDLKGCCDQLIECIKGKTG